MSGNQKKGKNIIELPIEEYTSPNNYQVKTITSKHLIQTNPYTNVNFLKINKNIKQYNNSFTTNEDDNNDESFISYEDISFLDLNE
jgi:hypothetical protein